MQLLLSLTDTLDHLIEILTLDREGLVRATFRVLGIWILAWLALRVVKLTAERIEKRWTTGTIPSPPSEKNAGVRSPSCSGAWAG
ncbi:MAG: hypothetical protein ACXWWN_09160 [Gemmatimonadales bacterium]